jgi:excisionase family DNA binding protein
LGHLSSRATRFLKGRKANRKEVTEMNRERLMRPREVAQQLSVSRSTVYRWYWEGRLRGVKLNGGTLRILESAVQAKLAEVD